MQIEFDSSNSQSIIMPMYRGVGHAKSNCQTEAFNESQEIFEATARGEKVFFECVCGDCHSYSTVVSAPSDRNEI